MYDKIIKELVKLLEIEKKYEQSDLSNFKNFREYLKKRDFDTERKRKYLINLIRKSKKELSEKFVENYIMDLLGDVEKKYDYNTLKGKIKELFNFKIEDWFVVAELNFYMNFPPLKIQGVKFYDVVYKREREELRKDLGLSKKNFDGLITNKSKNNCYAFTKVKALDPYESKKIGISRIKESLDILGLVAETDTKILDPEKSFAFNKNHITSIEIRDFLFAAAYWEDTIKDFKKIFKKIYTSPNPLIGIIKRSLYFYRRSCSDDDYNIKILFYVIALENLVCPDSRNEKKYDFCLRISTILHEKKDNSKTIIKRLKFLEKIYEIRNEIVHNGYKNDIEKVICHDELKNLRIIAKKIIYFYIKHSDKRDNKKIINAIENGDEYKKETSLIKMEGCLDIIRKLRNLSPAINKKMDDLMDELAI